MATLFDRLSGRLTERIGELIDDVRLPADVARRLDEAERAFADGDPSACLAAAAEVERLRPGLWRTRVLIGLASEALGDFERAATELTAAVNQRDDTLVRIALGRVATRLGALRTAREHFDKALERRPDDAERLEILRAAAGLDEQIGPLSRAVPTLRQALKLAPDDEQLMVRLARALRADDDLDGAIDALAPALELEPAPLDALLLAGRLWLARGRAGDLSDARRGYARILERSSDNPDALEGLASVHRAKGEVADALPLLHHALSTAPEHAHGRLHRAIGACYAASGQHDRALVALRAAVERDPDGFETWRDYAATALRVGPPDEAVAAAGRAAALRHEDRATRALLGRALLRVGDVEGARNTLSTLRAARMTGAELLALGELALRTGDPIEALALLREASTLGCPENEVAPLIEQAVVELAPRLPELPSADELGPTWLAPFLDAMSEAVARHPLLSDLIPHATALRQHLDTPLTVAVLGEFNAGKSTLINAFLAEDVVATGVLPTTCHVNVIRYGPRKVARWTRHDGTVEEIPYAEAQRLTKREPEAIANLEFCYPHPELRSIHFWDTPGFNAPDSVHEERAREALRTADAIVWMLDANQALTWSEFERILAIPNRAEKLMVVLNKADRLGDDPDARAEIEQHVGGHLEGRYVGLYWLSALRALEARRADDEPDARGVEASGWRAFDDALHEAVFERAGRLKSLEVATGLRAVLRDALERGRAAAAAVAERRGAIAEQRVELSARQARWVGEVGAASRAELNRALRDCRTQIGAEVNQLASAGGGLFARRELGDDDRLALRERIVDRTTAAHRELATSIARAVDEVDHELIAFVEATASAIGPPESRTLRRRLEAYLAETGALRHALGERLVDTPRAVASALTRELGDRILELVAIARSESERDAALQRLLPPVGAEYVAEIERWGREVLAVATGLCGHVERDLDILALDLEHRIMRPFSAVLEVIRSDETDAATLALEQ